MDIKEQEKIEAITYWMKAPIMDDGLVEYEQTAEQILINIIPLVRADMQRELRACFLKYLTVDSVTQDRRRKDYNQAIFDDKKGFAVFNGTNLDMVMDKFDMALKSGKEGE